MASKSSSPKLRKHVLDSKTEELLQLLDRFQEWPQLLDPYLAELSRVLLDGFLSYLATNQEQYFYHHSPGASPLPRAVCRILYALCKVRGYKIIVRLLNNEPRYIEPMLSSFKSWNDPSDSKRISALTRMIWEERYVMVLWLSHLMLAPFNLSTISAGILQANSKEIHELLIGLPGIAQEIVILALDQLQSASKEREAASILLVRLALRRDMQELSVPKRLVDYSSRSLLSDTNQEKVTIYSHLGYLALLYGIVDSGSDSEIAPILTQSFRLAVELATSTAKHLSILQDSAPSRKLLLKIMRACMIHAISLASAPSSTIDENILNSMLEDGIQHFLDSLKDKDTPVRMTASKALSVVALTLGPSMSAEVVEAVLGSLGEDVLFEDLNTSRIMASTEGIGFSPGQMKKNLSAVNPLKWHGLMLTIAHLLFRRSPPTYQLPDIIEALVLGLDFEQRSNVGTSIGVVVRDAACFGIWALARKYSTKELEMVDISDIVKPQNDGFANVQSTLQFLAQQLVVSACFDPSGNIRRGSSAALQELIGRHPDTILQGIPLVQIVDYHAVARRSKAIIDVAGQAASLGPTYQQELLQAVLSWRGARAADADSRRSASIISRNLLKSVSDDQLLAFTKRVGRELRGLKPTNLGSNAAARQGLLLCMAGVVELVSAIGLSTNSDVGREFEKIDIATIGGILDSRMTADLEYVMEALCKLITAMSQYFELKKQQKANQISLTWFEAARKVLNPCTTASEKDLLVEASAEANLAMFNLLDDASKEGCLNEWLNSKFQRGSEMTCRGRLMTMGLLYKAGLPLPMQRKIIEFLRDVLKSNVNIETRKNAMGSIGSILSGPNNNKELNIESFAPIIAMGLTDYSIDQRGDIGSILRLQSLDAADFFCEIAHQKSLETQSIDNVMRHVVRLAGENLTRVRFRAWQCLQRNWHWYLSPAKLHRTFDHVADISSEAYYVQLTQLMWLEPLRQHLIQGLISSVATGTDDISRASWSACISFLLQLPYNQRQEMQYVISSYTISHLKEVAPQNDREVVPVLQFLSNLIESALFSRSSIQSPGCQQLDICDVMQQVQLPKASFPRLEASITVYGTMLLIDHERRWAMDRLTRLLLHRWPKVRNLAANIIAANTSNKSLASCDWNAPVVDNKPAVLEIRKALNVATATVTEDYLHVQFTG